MLLNRPITAIMLILATLIFGAIALNGLSVNLLPEVDAPTLLVQTDWSGAAPREVEQRINEPLEGVLSTVPGLQEVQGFARQGQSVISLSFRWGQDMDLAFLNVREKLDQVRLSLPEQADRPQLVHTSASDEPIAVLGITSENRPDPGFETRLALKRWSEQVLARRLEQADGIAQVVLVGAVEPEVQIRYRSNRLDRYDLSLTEVQNLVEQANLFTATGELRDGWYRYSVKIESRIRSMEDVAEIPLKVLGDGKILHLSEVAEVEMDEADPTSFAMVDGSNVLNALIKKEYGANTVEVYDTLVPLLEELESQYPDIGLQVLQEDASFIRNTINNLLQTLLYGGILAFVVLFLFLDDLRTPFTIGIAIPVSIFLTFFVMYASDIHLNIVSLSGLTLGIGLLMDNAIIVLENISRHRPLAGSVISAASRGTREIALAISASTFTTISVFLPLVFLGGFEGAFFKDQAYTLSISLLASLLVALTVLPVLVVQIQKNREAGGASTGFSTFFNRIRSRYETSLQGALRRKRWFGLGAALLLAGALVQFLWVDKGIFPDTEPRELTWRVQLPGNTSLNASREAAADMTRYLANNGFRLGNIRVMGGYTDQNDLYSLAQEGFNKFRITVPVSGYEQAREAEQALEQYFERHRDWNYTSEGQQSAEWAQLPGGNRPPLVLQFVGINREESQQSADEFSRQVADRMNLPLSKQYEQTVDTWQLRFRTGRLLELGIEEQEVIRRLESLTRGSWVTDWNRQDENVAIRLVGLNRAIYDPSALILDIEGRNIPLQHVVEFHRSTEPEQLERMNQTPVLSYVGGWSFTDWWWRGGELQDAVQSFARETGREIRIAGSALDLSGLLQDMGVLLLISILIIYIILAVQFENLKYPLIIMCAVPFAWVGSIAILHLSGGSLNALSFMGILILTGIAVNDSILKVDFMRRYLEDTGDLQQAIRQASLHRFRPVVMTSVTTICGLIPMLLPIGDGWEFRQSLALALMGGMVTSTILTLYLIPMIFEWTEGGKGEGARGR